MGPWKDESQKKSKDLHVRLTATDMEIVRRNCAVAGYRSMTRYVTAMLTRDLPRHRGCRPGADPFVPEWLGPEMKVLTQQVRGVATNYNQTVTVLNAMMHNIDDGRVRNLVMRRADRLNSMTKELIRLLHEVRDMVDELSGAEDDYAD